MQVKQIQWKTEFQFDQCWSFVRKPFVRDAFVSHFFPLSRFAFFGIGAVVIHIGCHFCSISQKQTPPQQRRRREKMANEIEKEQSASESSTDKNNPVRARNRCISSARNDRLRKQRESPNEYYFLTSRSVSVFSHCNMCRRIFLCGFVIYDQLSALIRLVEPFSWLHSFQLVQMHAHFRSIYL